MPDADKEDALIVAVMRDGKVFLATTRSPPTMLTDKVKDRIANQDDKRVFVRADARAQYVSVIEVVDNVRAAGVDDLGPADRSEKTTGSPSRAASAPGGAEPAGNQGDILMGMAVGGTGGPEREY